ncbi:MAG: FAD-dependent monooxygenase, partial [Pseudomonadota bacterium]
MEDKRIRIQGAGIAGLTTGLALARHGFRPRIVEQAQEFGRVGAGIQISPNGVAVLDALGLGDKARERSVQAQGILLRTHRGSNVMRMDLTTAKRPYLLFHRSDLIDLLAFEVQMAEQIPVHFGCSPEPVLREDEILIGADGVRSRVRDLIGETKPPKFTGQVAWRALIPDPKPSRDVQVFMGPGRHLVTYSLADGSRNIVAVEERKDWAEDGWHHTDDSGDLHRAFSGFCDEAQELISAVTSPSVWGLFKRPVTAKWYKGKMVLVGDAAHTTLPFLGQGANMALEDAWILAYAL